MSKQTEALKLALEALNRNDYLGWQTNIHVRQAIREALAEQPASKPWVGLTDEEAHELWESTDSDWELMKRTEAKLREKNA